MSENGIAKAEQRVREMNRLTRQYSEQGNDFMRQDQRRRTQRSQQAQQTQQQPRFEPAAPQFTEPTRTSADAAAAESFTIPSGIDGEKLLILLIALVLIKGKTNVRLLLALAYILL